MTWEEMQETMAFLLVSQKSHDAQIEKLIENQAKHDEQIAKLTDSMKEWHEDRHQMHTTMLNLIERQDATFARMDKFAAEAAERDKAADARMERLEKLFERSITRGQNGH